MSQHELSEIVGVDKARTARAVSHLIYYRLAENTAFEGRAYKLHLTENGEEALESARYALDRVYYDLFRNISIEDIDNYHRISDVIYDNVEKYDNESTPTDRPP